MWLYRLALSFLLLQLILDCCYSSEYCSDNRGSMVKVSSTCFAKIGGLRAVILGAPASGKGTVSSRIVETFGVTHISSGDRLRDHVARGTELGKQVKKYLDEGRFVPDETMISLISHEFQSIKNQNILLDGFPRTVGQAEKLQQLHPINHVINLIVPHSTILERVKSRWVHLPSGRVYNIGFNDPKIPGKDDVTGEPLSQRIDDRPEVVAKRLKDYSTKTQPVIDYYRKLGILKDFEGKTTDEIWPKIKTFVGRLIDEKC